ncbi:MAG: Rrf2 family transcriptional regulator [Candidatus Omnitrophica bacterium]|nr:Rrf2 family transcriptional regulator [Candidatus Omnitrophota bacterium]MDD5079309.1 Rrf2 family transcriptional regulator [Candidatus Omnitrophota bacterium]
MLKLSTKGRYGVRLMLDLALHFGKGPISLKDISKRQEISEKYLWHLIPPLKNAGLVTATRGAHGGYILAKPASQINLQEIVSLLEGPMRLVECTQDLGACRRSNNCIVRDIWTEATDKFLDILSSFTLESIIKRHNGRFEAVVYNI